MSTLIPSQRHGAIAKNVAVLGFGTALAQFLNIIITPVLSWYYSPEAFGVMAASLSIVYIVASLSNANYDAAIVMPKEKEESADLLVLCLMMNVAVTVLFFGVAWFVTSFLERFAPYSSLWLLTMLAVGVLLMSSFNCLQVYAVRVEDYAASSASHVMRTLSCIIVQLVGVLFTSSAYWLIAGRVFGLAPAIAYL
ncbi:MAG: oligosaccharide flippase family protein, partial [Pseudomonadota bacterium]